MTGAKHNPIAKALDKRWLSKEIERNEKKSRARRIAELRANVRAARARRVEAMAAAGARCRAARDRSRELGKAAREARSRARSARRDAKGACAVPPGGAELLEALKRAREELALEQRHQRELRAIESSASDRAKVAKAKGRTAREARDESDDEVRNNIPPELVPLFDTVRRSIKGSPRRTRTEAFLEWVHENPSALYASIDDEVDAMIRAHERELRRANPGAKRKNGETPREIYERTHWGETGPRKRPLAMHVPDPKMGDLVALGRVRRIDYETDKGDGLEIFFHDFGREVKLGSERGRPKRERCPVLAFNADGLFIVGGNYRVKTEGIVG